MPEPGSGRPRVIAVVGPTAIGKSAVAEALALALDGEVVSADSMQIYRGMDIGTAKEPIARRSVPYHCVDLVEPGAAYSAALFQHDARAAIDDIASRGRTPVLAGGTGLYVRAALDDLEFPEGDSTSPEREAVEADLERLGPAGLHALLAERDPASAALIHPNNVRRVVRALEMLATGDVSYAAQAAGLARRRSFYPATMIGLTMERSALYDRIDARVDAMVAAGLEEEVRGLFDGGYRDAMTAAQAIGYKEIVPVIEHGGDLAEAVEAIKQATRRYAKRQFTWFRADPRVHWLDVTELSHAEAAAAARALIESVGAADAHERAAADPDSVRS
jgi:tRNA dimethylallyltransferase